MSRIPTWQVENYSMKGGNSGKIKCVFGVIDCWFLSPPTYHQYVNFCKIVQQDLPLRGHSFTTCTQSVENTDPPPPSDIHIYVVLV